MGTAAIAFKFSEVWLLPEVLIRSTLEGEAELERRPLLRMLGGGSNTGLQQATAGTRTRLQHALANAHLRRRA